FDHLQRGAQVVQYGHELHCSGGKGLASQPEGQPASQLAYFCFWATINWSSTLNTPGTDLAWVSAICLSIWLSTTPASVTWPLLTTMRIGASGTMAYFCMA